MAAGRGQGLVSDEGSNIWGAEHGKCLHDGPLATQHLNLFSACLLSVRRYMPEAVNVTVTIQATTTQTSFENCLAQCSTDTCAFVTYNYDNGQCTTISPTGNMVR